VTIAGSYTGGTATLTQVNNTFYGLSEEIVLSFGPSVIANNIFVNTNVATSTSAGFGAGLNCASGAAAAIDIHNNDIFNYGALVPSGCSLNFTNLQLDPQLKNPQNGDLREQDTSPLIAAGDTTAPLIPYVDLDSKARTVCGTIDIGGYEHHPQPPLP